MLCDKLIQKNPKKTHLQSTHAAPSLKEHLTYSMKPINAKQNKTKKLFHCESFYEIKRKRWKHSYNCNLRNLIGNGNTSLISQKVESILRGG